MSTECHNCYGDNTRELTETEAYMGGNSHYCYDCDINFGEDNDPSETSNNRLDYESDDDYRDRMEDLGYDEFN